MKKRKLIFPLIILLCVCIFLLFSCAEKDVIHDEGEILSAAEDLISESVLWNRIFYIEGLLPLEGGRSYGDYREVDPAYLSEIGLSSVAEIVAYGERIYSESMMALFKETMFSAIKTDVGGVSSPAVCIDYTERIDGTERFLCVMVDPSESPRFHAPALEYFFDTMQIEYNRNGRASVSVSVRRIEDGARSSIKVTLVLENEVWLLDSYTAFADFQGEQS